MAGIRLTGLSSGMDTQSLIADLSKAYQMKVDNAKKKQTKAEWKKEAWGSLNTKIFDFYKDSLSTFKSSTTYSSKKVSGDLDGVSISAGAKAVSGTHKVKVEDVAGAQMWTGNQVRKNSTDEETASGSTKLTEMGIEVGTKFVVGRKDGSRAEVTVDADMTLESLATSLGTEAGINASYDSNQGRFYLSSKNTGSKDSFTLQVVKRNGTTEEMETADSDSVLGKLGLNLKNGDDGKLNASDAAIIYNGVRYESNTNNFDINGLTFNVTQKTEKIQSFSIDVDTDGIYDKIKGFVKEYNNLITEMNKLYSADSSRGYEPLTSEEKDAMSEDEVKEWEKKIKDSLLRRDSTISSLLSSMRTTLNKSVEVTNADGTKSNYTLASFGVETGTYLENGKLHILGDSEDSDYSEKDNLLKAAIANNPDALMQTFTKIGNEVYSNLQKAMKGTEMSSAMTFYNDKQMDSEIKTYKDDVKALQKKLTEEEDKYYKQFAAMETAMSKLQSQQTYISQLFGGA